MAWILESFDGVALPDVQYEQETGPAPSASAIVNLPFGRFVDAYGSGATPGQLPYDLPYQCILPAASEAALVAALAPFKHCDRRRRAQLYRELETGEMQWCWAKLKSLGIPRKLEHRRHLLCEFVFQILSRWFGESHGVGWYLDDGEYLDDGLYLNDKLAFTFSCEDEGGTITLSNAGDALQDEVVLTFSVSGHTAQIANLSVAIAGYSKFSYSGVLTPVDTLVIDTGARSITVNGVGAYAGFALDAADHRTRYWLALQPGDNQITLAWDNQGAGGDLSVAAAYYDPWE